VGCRGTTGVREIVTLDRRHSTAVPSHVEAFTLLFESLA
jgi:hypothetical protein